MRKDNRKFCASIYVRNGEQRVKLELSPASQHGGPEGFYRVRVERRWLNTEDGRPRWFDRDGLARLAAELAVCGLDIPAPVPAVPYPSRVSVRRVEDGFSCYYGQAGGIMPYPYHLESGGESGRHNAVCAGG